ncbi:hypothetical protein KP78_15780 [Jeotgalibacillus soli]|uniref:Uncharacterized protein n=1 Tax=Jeotgalibacillus soli TaxID=889306 RepID=A0A0C2RE29_9BACL|nr:hypothetical protein KP78_15780 [Jeotgalibacillus soli]
MFLPRFFSDFIPFKVAVVSELVALRTYKPESLAAAMTLYMDQTIFCIAFFI